MNKHINIYFTLIGLLGLLFSCEEEGTKVKLNSNPTVPTLVTVPDLMLERVNGTDILEFVGTRVDPGFQSSAIYTLEAGAAGTNFADVTTLISTNDPTSMKISVSDLNGILLKKFPADKVSSIDLRLRSVLVVDAGTGAPGTSADPFEYTSETMTKNVALYGLPRLDLIGSGMDQYIQSALGNGSYTSYVKLSTSNSFTLNDPDAGIDYGANGSALAVDGNAIVPPSNGWFRLDVDTNALTYTLTPYSVGVVGAFSGWGGSPDVVMDYDVAKGYWVTTLDLPTGEMKFRLNSDWGVNWGPGANTDLPATGGPMPLPNSSGNIVITSAGNYTIQVTTNGSSAVSTFIKN
jgi:hypothetical protein